MKSLYCLVVLLCCALGPLADGARAAAEETLVGTAPTAGKLDAIKAREAYRRGEYPLAITLWQDALRATQLEEGDQSLDATSALRGSLCYHLGNAHYRNGQSMQALAWYEAALRHLPRDEDVRSNYVLVRGELGLPPARGSGFLATITHWISLWTPAEARSLFMWAVALLALVLLLEAWFGGKLMRYLAWSAAAVVLLASLPWLRHSLRSQDSAAMVVSERGAPGRSEPRVDARTLTSLRAAELVYPEDQWQDWLKVRTAEGKHVWIGSEKVLSVKR